MCKLTLPRLLALLLSLTLLLTGCTAGQTGESSVPLEEQTPVQRATTTDGTFSLPYSSTDSFNPYAAATKCNQEICQLLYDTLVTLDGEFQPVYRLADSITTNGTRMVIRLKSATFTDGKTVTAEDVTYSIAQAKASNTRYAAQLAEIVGYAAANQSTVELTLSGQDPFAENLLDFPILEQNTAGRTDTDGKAVPPVGSGRYIYDAEGACLNANPDYVGGQMQIATIQLVETPDDESLSHNIEIGNISFAYTDMNNNSTLTMTGVSQRVDNNQLIFLGINYANGYLEDARFRQAVSLALDRSALATGAYYTYADPAYTPFPEAWAKRNSLTELYCTEDLQRAVAILQELGYNDTDEEGYRLNSTGKRLAFTLLVNGENAARTAAANLVASQLAAIGLQITVQAVSWEAYHAALTAGHYDFYLGEARLMANMDFSSLVTPDSGACFGYIKPSAEPTDDEASSSASDTVSQASSDVASANTESTSPDATAVDPNAAEAEPEAVIIATCDVYSNFYAGSATLSDVLSAFRSELPIIPLCRHYGQICYTSDIAVSPESTASDLFFNIQNLAFYAS